ncbi:aromatic amino acid hydroxylase [Haliea sp.]|uniref:aromatic amino acid hydroxylase n=1 Tax=Haliea sp. TaxID=1932666 RepID=UPI0035288E64
MTQEEVVASLPTHLRPFVAVQDYRQQYTAQDQALWRFIMRHLVRQLRDTAHPVYLEGLARTGIALDHIPSIDEMNACLAQLGWRAVVVEGFIPPAIFMEFQALRVLVIALDMRSVEHVVYTPAPDIVHEAAGHAPFIVDVDYAEFLQRFGEIGMRAIASRRDHAQYEAIRELSILKETPGVEPQRIAAAEQALNALQAVEEAPSEAALLARLHWWTVEYGLVGDVADYRLFGAGLLSSLGEGRHCLDDLQVRKLPLTVDAVSQTYDITREQPQLYVTRSCRHLSQVLEEFAATMAYRVGGAAALRQAIAAGTVCTAEYDTGVQVSGCFTSVLCDAVGKAVYMQCVGPTQIAFQGAEIYGHGTTTHAEGFGSPIGKLKDFTRCLSEYSVDELKAHNIRIGKPVCLEFLSGITVRGYLQDVLRQEHRNLLLSFSDCTVTDLQGEVLFEPAWGRYDMAVGGAICSVFGGSADRAKYPLYQPVSSARSPRATPDAELEAAYHAVATLALGADQAPVVRALDARPEDWLLRAEVLALGDRAPATLAQRARRELRDIGAAHPELQEVLALVS